MIPFDPSEIVNWADKPDAPHKLPELIRRLILATVPMPWLLHMPSGSSVWRPGWDGMLVVENGNAWVPDGASRWELSCQKQPKRKATTDYKKRTADPEATFVFVTPRNWDEDDKRKWASERSEKREWADVRTLNVDDHSGLARTGAGGCPMVRPSNLQVSHYWRLSLSKNGGKTGLSVSKPRYLPWSW